MEHRRICSRHFDDEVLKDPSDVSKGLKRHAVPTLFEIELLQDVQYLEIHREQVKQSLRIEKSKTEAENEINYRFMYEAELNKVQELNRQLHDERTSKRNLLRLCKKRKEILIRKNQQIHILKNVVKKKTTLRKDDKLILETVKNNPIWMESIKNMNKKKHGRRYKFARKFVTRQRLVSTAGYKKLRSAKMLCMPHPKTINKWHQDIDISAGFNEEILKRMKRAGETMGEKEKVVSIMIDGMALKPMIDYHARSDKFHGLPTVDTSRDQLRENNDPLALATESVTVMIRSLSTNYKQVIGYFFANATLGSDFQKKLCVRQSQNLFQLGFTLYYS